MIPRGRVDILEAGIASLERFAQRTGARGRFVALYLGLRRMGDDLATLGSTDSTRARTIEDFMDRLLIKTHRTEPFVVLTAPFGGSTSPTAPYSTRTGVKAPGNQYATNTWRNNLSIQKGIGCPAQAATIRELLANPALRLACPHMASDPEGQHLCTLEGTAYRGEEHSIWLRKTDDGWQGVDLDDPATYSMYLAPGGESVPVFALIAALYCDALTDVYPEREVVGIPDFASDFRFSVQQVESIFNCDPTHPENRAVLRVVEQRVVIAPPLDPLFEGARDEGDPPDGRAPDPLPHLAGPVLANSGLGAELAVAADLASYGWQVSYRGSQTGVGFDLEAQSQDALLCVEVKSSIGFTTPELTESEWGAACHLGDQFVLAIVDFYGSAQQVLWYVRNPAATATPTERTATVYRMARAALQAESTEAEFL
jgi:Domain of unknown function (DUF3883)